MNSFLILSLSVMTCLPFQVFSAPFGHVIWWGNPVEAESSGNVRGPDSSGAVLIDGQFLTNATAVATGHSHALAIRGDGTVVGWGFNRSGQAVGAVLTGKDYASGLVQTSGHALSNVVSIAAGWQHSLAVCADGSVVTWGSDALDPHGSKRTTLTNAILAAAGMGRSLVLTRTGSVVGWGDRKVPDGLTNIVSIAVADLDFGLDLAIQSNETVMQWGRNGALVSAPGNLTNIISVASGSMQSLALRRDGFVLEWDKSARLASFVPDLSNVVAIASAQMNCLALKADGTVIAWGRFGFLPATVPEGLSNVVAIAAGPDYCLAITTNKAVADRFRQ